MVDTMTMRTTVEQHNYGMRDRIEKASPTILDRISARMRHKPLIEPTGIVWDLAAHRAWGDSMSWSNFAEREVSGHMTPTPRVGDEIRSPLVPSQRTGRFRVIQVQTYPDPPDLFHATVEDIGYLDEDPTAGPVHEPERSIFS